MDCNFDCHFVKSINHPICEDYAVVYDNMGILSDGCSSSKNTDIGARILAHSFADVLACGFDGKVNDDIFLKTIHSAKKVIDQLALKNECLDATLHSIIVDEEQIHINCIGDGVIYIKRIDGQEILLNLDSPSGYPYYLSYKLDFARELNILSMENYGTTISQDEFEILKNQFHYKMSLLKENVDTILLFSDGINQIYNNGNRILLSELKELFNIKIRKGEFVKRLFNKIDNKYGYKCHHDDLSCIGYLA